MTRQDVEHDRETDSDDDEPADARHTTERHDEHLRDVEVGAGCTEIWEHLSDQRDEE